MKTLKSPFDYQNEIFDYPRQHCDFQNTTFEHSNQILISKRNIFKRRLLTPTIKIDISKRDFIKMISKKEVSISPMGCPNVEGNFDFQHI